MYKRPLPIPAIEAVRRVYPDGRDFTARDSECETPLSAAIASNNGRVDTTDCIDVEFFDGFGDYRIKSVVQSVANGHLYVW